MYTYTQYKDNGNIVSGVLGQQSPPPHQLGSLGERYKLPQRPTDFSHFGVPRTALLYEAPEHAWGPPDRGVRGVLPPALGKLSNRFRLQVYERLVSTIQFNGYLWTHPNSNYTVPTQAWPLSVTGQSSVVQLITNHNETSARLMVCLKKLTFVFSLIRFFGAFCGKSKRYILQQKCLKKECDC